MHRPPAVSLACRDGGAWRVAVALLQGLTVASVLTWLAHPMLAWVGVLVGLFAWSLSLPSVAVLAWDGQAWQLDGRSGRALVAIDLGGWMLLQFVADAADGHRSRRTWLPLSAAAGAWAPMRRALHASEFTPVLSHDDPRTAG